jgi:hypothetical protein
LTRGERISIMAMKTMEGNVRRETRTGAWMALLLGAIALLAVGCSVAAIQSREPTEEPRQPFSARREREDGAVVAWSGYVDGYEPGEEASFDVTIMNETDEAWPGRFCLQLMDDDLPQVVAVLEQRPFNLEPGLGFSDVITVTFPEDLEAGVYGLSFVVRGPGEPSVDLVPIAVGDTDEGHGPTTQEHMDAALEACPEVTGARWEAENLVALARQDLAERLGVSPDEIVLQDVEEVEFSDASLGVPEPGKMYAQVITPGFVIRLEVDGKSYEYHAAGERVVLAVEGASGG